MTNWNIDCQKSQSYIRSRFAQPPTTTVTPPLFCAYQVAPLVYFMSNSTFILSGFYHYCSQFSPTLALFQNFPNFTCIYVCVWEHFVVGYAFVFCGCAVVIEMASDESSAAIRVEEAAPDLANGSNESSTSKVSAEELEDKVDELALDVPQGHFAAALICSYLISVYWELLVLIDSASKNVTDAWKTLTF